MFTLEGEPISWKYILQSTIALSTIEVKYMTLIEAIKEAIWLRGLLDELGVGQKQIFIYSDSQYYLFSKESSVPYSYEVY